MATSGGKRRDAAAGDERVGGKFGNDEAADRHSAGVPAETIAPEGASDASETAGRARNAEQADQWASDLAKACKAEFDQVNRELDELRLLIKQSGKELEKLKERKILTAAKVREMEGQLELYPRQEIRTAYLAASEAEMRAFMITEQRDQLQAKLRTYERYAVFLKRTIDALATLADEIQVLTWQPTAPQPAVPEVALGNGASAQAGMVGMPPFIGSGSLTRQNAELETLARVISGQERVRRRVAQRLHDGPTQSLANAVLTAEICEKLVRSDPRRALSELGNLKGIVNATLQETRKFIFELLPMTLDDLGLIATLRRYGSDISTKYQVQVALTLPQGDQAIPKDTAVAVFRVAQEGITNAVEHSRATLIRLTLDLPPEGLVLVVEDNGSGFDVEQALARTIAHQAQGITSMQERAEVLGGWLRIESTRGRGSRVELSVPL